MSESFIGFNSLLEMYGYVPMSEPHQLNTGMSVWIWITLAISLFSKHYGTINYWIEFMYFISGFVIKLLFYTVTREIITKKIRLPIRIVVTTYC